MNQTAVPIKSSGNTAGFEILFYMNMRKAWQPNAKLELSEDSALEWQKRHY
ncbi:hypothetical protein HF669_03695 [Acidithiobacillus thiooxidans]|jgi:hypothetical protein|nr:hypothetical protein [Acidithiobacillus thiooxidans]MBU2810496.1 hypothetical protein [Acidithiobacillus thiooxidans]